MPKISEIPRSEFYSNLAMLSLCIYALTIIPFEPISKIGQLFFLILSLPIFFIERKKIFKDPMVIILGCVLIIQAASWLNSVYEYPDFASSGPKLDRLAKLFLFVFIAYWLKGSVQKTYILMYCYALGVVIAVITYPNFTSELLAGLDGHRVDFGIKNAQFTSMVSAVGMIISIFLIYQSTVHGAALNRCKYYLLPLNIILILIFIAIIIMSQSRQVWMAIIVTLLLTPLFITWALKNTNKKITILFYSFLLISVLSLYNIDIIHNRVHTQISTISLFLSGDLRSIPMDSVGIRVLSWIESWSWIKDNPIIGADVNAIKQVLVQSPLFTELLKVENYGHLHNYHIEVLVAYGILGLLAIYAIYWWLIFSLSKIKEQIPEAAPFALLAAVFCCFWFIVNCFETYNGRSYGVFTHNIILGCCYTFYLTHYLQTGKEE